MYVSDNWVVQNLQNSLENWNEKLAEVWELLTAVSYTHLTLPTICSV